MSENATQQPFLVVLDDGMIRAEGPDTEQFLQGQLSCDVTALRSRHSSLGCICNTQGRVISAFRIITRGETCFLALPPGMEAIARQHLSRYAVFFETELVTDDTAYRRFGVAVPDGDRTLSTLSSLFSGALPLAGETLQDDTGRLIVNLGEAGGLQRYELWIPGELPDPLPDLRAAGLNEAQPGAWQRLDILAGRHLPTPDQSGAYTPEELNLDLTDAVSFTKGCYTGQEVVARMHYRGKGRKRLLRFQSLEATGERDDLPGSPGELTITDAGQDRTALPVVSLVRDGQQLLGLAVGNLDRQPDEPRLVTTGGEGIAVRTEPAGADPG